MDFTDHKHKVNGSRNGTPQGLAEAQSHYIHFCLFLITSYNIFKANSSDLLKGLLKIVGWQEVLASTY